MKQNHLTKDELIAQEKQKELLAKQTAEVERLKAVANEKLIPLIKDIFATPAEAETYLNWVAQLVKAASQRKVSEALAGITIGDLDITTGIPGTEEEIAKVKNIQAVLCDEGLTGASTLIEGSADEIELSRKEATKTFGWNDITFETLS